jgi:ketosteroid isomerase-like protein
VIEDRDPSGSGFAARIQGRGQRHAGLVTKARQTNVNPEEIAMNPGDLVKDYWAALERRDWERAESFLAPDVVIEHPDSGRVWRGRDSFMTFNRTYPGEWHVAVVRSIAGENEVAAEVAAINNGVREACLGFYTLHDGQIAHAKEWWMTPAVTNEAMEGPSNHV